MARSIPRMDGPSPGYEEMGERLRAARVGHGLSLRTLADRLGVSASLISQVETGRAKPSVSTLYAIANELGISLDELLFPDAAPQARLDDSADEARTVRGSTAAPLTYQPFQPASSRARIRLASGVVWERLTTVSLPNADFLYVTYEVGGASSSEHEFQRHNGQEWGYVLEGTLGVTIGFDEYTLSPGDAISFESSTPHRLYNAGDEPVHAIWFVLGRRPLEMSQMGSGENGEEG